uniref:Synaptotagmin like 3 n=1 Tax=Malurus cyaneus samueli TaxID=2593467 RepID=A0A8C5TEA0_9PASS
MACEFNLNFLKELEREAVLEVLYRDQMVRKTEEERIRKMKLQLQQLRWKGAKNVRHDYQERCCARCQKSLGLLMNRGAVCNGCSHRVCSECRVCLNPGLWKCTICFAHGDVKVKAGEWFFEERKTSLKKTWDMLYRNLVFFSLFPSPIYRNLESLEGLISLWRTCFCVSQHI